MKNYKNNIKMPCVSDERRDELMKYFDDEILPPCGTDITYPASVMVKFEKYLIEQGVSYYGMAISGTAPYFRASRDKKNLVKNPYNLESEEDYCTSTYDSNFNKLFELCCESSNISNQHQVMLNNWIDDLAKGLWEFNGKHGDWEHYRYQALKGVYNVNDPCSSSILSNETYEQYKSNYENNITEQFNFEACD